MALDKITPNDSRMKDGYANVNGHRWHYFRADPQGQVKGTVVLVHGFPDIWLAWRYQIPMLLSLNLRCIALECMGYGDTGASSSLHLYGFKAHADAIAAISKDLGVSKIILGGHDWGGAVVYRVAMWCPELVSHVFSVATPYWSPSDKYLSNQAVVDGGTKQFGYQLQFGSDDEKLEKVVGGDEGRMRKLLMGAYGGKPKTGKVFLTPEKGIDLSILEEGEEIGMTPLLSEEELDYYVKQFMKNGIHGPCNWYRTRKVNFEDELSMPAEQRKGLQQPVLFIQALRDNILTPELSRGMERSIPNLTRREVPSSHWALWHTPEETNGYIQAWIEEVVFGGKSKL